MLSLTDVLGLHVDGRRAGSDVMTSALVYPTTQNFKKIRNKRKQKVKIVEQNESGPGAEGRCMINS